MRIKKNGRHESWHAVNALNRIGDLEWTAKNIADTKHANWQQKIELALEESFPDASELEIVLPCMYSGGFNPKPIQPLGASQYWTRLIPEESNKMLYSKTVEKSALLVFGQSELNPWFHAYLQATHEVPIVCLTMTKYDDPVMARTLYTDPELWKWVQKIISKYSSTYINPFMHGIETHNLYTKLKSRLPGINLRIAGGCPNAHINWNNKIFVRDRIKDVLGDKYILKYKSAKDLKEIIQTVMQFIDDCPTVKIQLPDTGGAGGLKVFNRDSIKKNGGNKFGDYLKEWFQNEDWKYKEPVLIEEWVVDKILKNYQNRPISLSTHGYLNENGTIIFRGTKLQLWYEDNNPISGCSGGIGARYLVDNEIIRRVIELSYLIWNEMVKDGVVGMASPDWIVLNDGRIILVECNVRWSDTSSHDGVEIWSYPFDFMGDCLSQGNEQLVIKGKILSPRDMILYYTEAAIRDGIEKQVSFRFITPIILGLEDAGKIESKITVVISCASRNDLEPGNRIELIDTTRNFFKNLASSFK